MKHILQIFGRRSVVSFAAVLGATTLLSASGQARTDANRVALKPAPRGIPLLNQVRRQELALSPARPQRVTRIPKGITAPYYTTIQLGPRDKPCRFTILVDAPEGKPSRLFVDANGNGDLTDDGPAEWLHKSYAGRENDHLLLSYGGANLQVRYGTKKVSMHVSLSRYDTTEPTRAAQFLPIVCTADYAREGSVALGGKTYRIWLADALTRGDFRGSGKPGQSGIFLLIDVNGNGKIDSRGETFDATEPFNISGVTYEARNVDAAGTGIEIVRSARTVQEISLPPDLSVGKRVVAFESTATNGRSVKFPGDYKGKLVLLYFWATWCGDCNREVPYLTRAYAAYHDRSLEVLGISLDLADQAVQLAAYTGQHHMDWPEIYDGKVWEAEIAQLYFITHTPTALLVDGDTGTILANGSDLLGDRLASTIKKAIESH